MKSAELETVCSIGVGCGLFSTFLFAILAVANLVTGDLYRFFLAVVICLISFGLSWYCDKKAQWNN